MSSSCAPFTILKSHFLRLGAKDGFAIFEFIIPYDGYLLCFYGRSFFLSLKSTKCLFCSLREHTDGEYMVIDG